MDIATGKQNTGRAIVFPIAILCMLFSGVAGLVYQVVWTRYLALMTGHTSYAIVAVLAAFMGGLALGNALLGRVADKLRRPFAFYGWLEIIIGVYALAFPLIFQFANEFYIGAAKSAGGSLLGLKFAVAVTTLLIPTMLMGGTLPVLARMLTHSLGELRDRVSTLYFINSMGAVIGVGIAEFWLIPDLGVEETMFCGAMMNLCVGALALIVSGYVREEDSRMEAAREDIREAIESFSPGEIRLAILGIGLSGFVAMLYEVAWTRLLGLTMGSTSGAFAIMLITFILGIAIGSWLIGRIRNIRNSLNWFAWMEIGIGASIIVMMFLYSRLPYWFIWLANTVNREESNYAFFQSLEGLFCFAVMIIPTTILGMTLPLVSRISTAELARTGRSVGFTFSFNTIGAVLGAILTGLWLMPSLGLARTFALGTGLNIAIGIVILGRNAAPARRKLLPLILPGVALWVFLAGVLFHTDWAKLTTAGAFRIPDKLPQSYAEFREVNLRPELLYHRDGAGSTVSVKEYPKDHIFLQVNGKTDASTGKDMLTQLMLAHVPALLHPQPESALIIGFGSGVTCGALLTHPNIQRTDVVEISPEVIEAAHYFKHVNENVLENDRLKIHVEDAKAFLQITEQRFDIIISEPSNPWMAGVPGLYSVEFYTDCAKRLNSGGLMCQWLHLYEINSPSVDTIVATFTGQFQYTTVWNTLPTDLLLIGSMQPHQTKLGTFLQRFKQPAISASLASGGITRPSTLLAHELISEDYTAYAYPEDTLLHQDMYPVLETLAQKGKFVGKGTLHLFAFDERNTARPNSLLAQYMAKYPLQREDWVALFTHNAEEVLIDHRLIRSVCEEWATQYPKDPSPIMMVLGLEDSRHPSGIDIARMAEKLGQILSNPRNNEVWSIRYAFAVMASYRYHRTVFHTPPGEALASTMKKLAGTFPNAAHIYNSYLAELLWDNGNQAQFLQIAEEIFISNGSQLSLQSFPDEERGPAIILNRLINHYLSARHPDKLAIAVEVATNGGFASANNPRLQATIARAHHLYRSESSTTP